MLYKVSRLLECAIYLERALESRRRLREERHLFNFNLCPPFYFVRERNAHRAPLVTRALFPNESDAPKNSLFRRQRRTPLQTRLKMCDTLKSGKLCRLGARGAVCSLVSRTTGAKVLAQRAVQAPSFVDATGAGDAFVQSGVLWRIFRVGFGDVGGSLVFFLGGGFYSSLTNASSGGLKRRALEYVPTLEYVPN